MFKSLTFIVLLTFLVLSLKAQHTILKDQVTADYPLKISLRNIENNIYTNSLLQEIAYQNSTSFGDLNIWLDYTIDVNIHQAKNEKQFVEFKIEENSINGDTHIKTIDIKEYLFPSVCLFECLIKKKNSNLIYDQLFVSQKYRNHSLLINKPLENVLPSDSIEIEFLSISFNYSEDDFIKFKEVLSCTKDCQMTTYLADQLLEEYQDWRPDLEPEKVLNYFKIREFERLLDVLNTFQFEKKLNLYENDPFDYIPRMKKLKALKRRMNTLFGNQINTVLDYPNPTELANTLIDRQYIYYQLMEDYSGDSEGYLNKIMLMNYSNRLMTRIFLNFSSKNSEKGIDRKAMYFKKLIDALLDIHIKKANELIGEKKFLRAEVQINNAQKLSELSKNEKANEINLLRSMYVYGIYYSYLDIAFRALEVPIIDMAILYLNKATEYQSSNSEIIQDNSAVVNHYGELGIVLIEKIKTMREQGELIKAGYYIKELTNICLQTKDSELIQKLLLELRALYALGENRLGELNYFRYSKLKKEDAAKMHQEILMIRNNQKNLLVNMNKLGLN